MDAARRRPSSRAAMPPRAGQPVPRVRRSNMSLAHVGHVVAKDDKIRSQGGSLLLQQGIAQPACGVFNADAAACGQPRARRPAAPCRQCPAVGTIAVQMQRPVRIPPAGRGRRSWRAGSARGVGQAGAAQTRELWNPPRQRGRAAALNRAQALAAQGKTVPPQGTDGPFGRKGFAMSAKAVLSWSICCVAGAGHGGALPDWGAKGRARGGRACRGPIGGMDFRCRGCVVDQVWAACAAPDAAAIIRA